MKKLLTWLLVCTFALSLTACRAPQNEGSQAESESQAQIESESQAQIESESKTQSEIKTLDDLKGKTIAVQLGTTGDIYADDIEGATVERFVSAVDTVMALRQGKVDAVVIDDQPAKVFVEQNDDIVLLEEPLTVEEYAICVSKKNPELTAAMNEAIAALRADGTLQNILDYYIGQVEGATPYQSPADADHSKGTLKMATNATFPPYEYMENDQVCGLDPDFARAICDRMGYALEIEHMDFDAVIVSVQSGKSDFGAAGMTKTEDRLKSIDFTDSYVTASQVIIVRK